LHGSAPQVAWFSSQTALATSELRAHLGRHLPNRNAFVALNTAFMRDGALVHIPAGYQAEQPIYLVFLASAAGSTSFPRTLIVAGAGSQATVVEIHLGAHGRPTLSNAATEIVLQPNAQLAYHTIQKPSAAGFHIGHVAATQASGSALSVHSLSLDGRIVRNDIHTVLAGESCSCNLDGVYLADGTGQVDNQTTIDHCGPRSTSREDYRGVVGGSGHAVFSGRIIVRPGAGKTDAQQTNRNLLLSDSAQVNSKPQLEIFTSDVKCSHGATTGQLDPDAVFYLRARGIDAREANRILIGAFLHQSLERIASAQLRTELKALLDRRIAELGRREDRP
jgi:Fe-S cluster assembly protein SufD